MFDRKLVREQIDSNEAYEPYDGDALGRISASQ